MIEDTTDAAILAMLGTHQPVQGEKNVWTFWHAGLAASPPWLKRNVIGWVRRLSPKGWTVRVLDTVPDSPNHAHRFLSPSQFHNAFNNGTITAYAGAVASDVLRLPLLHVHGGIWMDMGTMLFVDLDEAVWRLLEDASSPYEIAGFATDLQPTPGNDVVMSYFLAARRGNPFIKRWHAVLLALWADGRTDGLGLSRHPLLRPVDLIKIPPNLRTKNAIDEEKFNDYVHIYLAAKRVRMLVDKADSWDGPAYWERHAMVLPVVQSYMLYVKTEFDGRRQFDLLSRAREGVEKDEKWHEAEELVQAVAGTMMMKLSHGMRNNETVHLASFWDSPEYENYDVREGTFAAHLRWVSLYGDGRRVVQPYEIPTSGRVLHAALLEVVE